MYSELVNALKALTCAAFTEDEWATRPQGDHGTVQLDFHSSQDSGDGEHIDTAWEGSVDLYTHDAGWTQAAQVETILESICGAGWRLNLKTYENETGLTHREYVFELEAL